MPLSYVHDLNPILIQFGDALAIRWYGIAYLAGFIAGYFLLKHLSRKRLYPVPEEKLGDFITWAAVFGVIIGGRLGYVLFYMIPNDWQGFLDRPWEAFYLQRGGMSSHGGMIGIILFSLFYARRHKYNWPSILDGLAIVAPVGLFFGRIANFINGELYGRITHGASSLGMKFPAEFFENYQLRAKAMAAVKEQIAPESLAQWNQLQPIPEAPDYTAAAWLVDRVRDTPQIKAIAGNILPDRYPSQLFEGLAEGLILFAILWSVRIMWKKAYSGIFCGIFCIVYAIGRIVVENYREPDIGAELWLGLTRGQFLSVFLVFLSAGFFIYAFRTKHQLPSK